MPVVSALVLLLYYLPFTQDSGWRPALLRWPRVDQTDTGEQSLGQDF